MEFLIALALNILESKPIVYVKQNSAIIRHVEASDVPLSIIENYNTITERRSIDTENEPVICTGLFCFCVTYIREQKGVDIRGDAKYLVPNYFGEPARGDVILFKYSNGVWHVAYIEEVYNGVYYVSEANYHAGKEGNRLINFDDPDIVGFIRK